MAKKFTRKIENFVCLNCGFKVTGSGYTNHCPSCLFSKHVDINPGDRQEACGGLMKPIGVEMKAGKYILVHKCQKCGITRKNKAASNDNMDELIKLAQNIAKS